MRHFCFFFGGDDKNINIIYFYIFFLSIFINYQSVHLSRTLTVRSRGGINNKYSGLRSLGAQEKLSFSIQCNQKIQAFMHRFSCILLEIRSVIKIYTVLTSGATIIKFENMKT